MNHVQCEASRGGRGRIAAIEAVTERDICRSAEAPIDTYGDDATIHAALRAEKLLQRGDLDGAAVFATD